ncbi:flagellar basal body rod protein FlgC [Melioribacteraceae bacterium 4301-Me]|uniref:flagellar basal body rod protein FlgC n=1 Tax=Pyranulibacter aquaticus TaxID=3163344 RepID=UPI0035990051
MKIGDVFKAFEISAKGLAIQRKKMNLIAENIANSDTTRTKEGTPYKRQFLRVIQDEQASINNLNDAMPTITLKGTNENHIVNSQDQPQDLNGENTLGIDSQVEQDTTQGELVYMPGHPDADQNGYVQMPNVNIINEMVDMIEATRNYEANLTALNSSKQIVKDTLEI